MDYNQMLEYINNESKRGSVYSLDSMKNLLCELDNIDRKLNIINIAGTNGKGSTSSFITNILVDAGYKVGTFNSPSVYSFNECFLINGKAISDEQCVKYISQIKEIKNKIEEKDVNLSPTCFEQQLAASLMLFKDESCDIVILEAGMGGTNDATNAIDKNLAAIITSINYDHTEYLGNTLEEIAQNKFGIVRKNLITCKQNKKIMKIFRKAPFLRVCKKATLQIKTDTSQTFLYGKRQYKIQMKGEHQISNATLAIETAKLLRLKGYKISYKNITRGLFNTKLEGRIEKIVYNDKIIYLDGAHNPEAAKALSNTISSFINENNSALVYAAFKDKDIDNVLKNFKYFSSPIYIAKAPSQRGIDVLTLKNICLKYYNNVITNTSITKALENALKSDKKYIIVFGSFSILNEARNYLRGTNG